MGEFRTFGHNKAAPRDASPHLKSSDSIQETKCQGEPSPVSREKNQILVLIPDMDKAQSIVVLHKFSN